MEAGPWARMSTSRLIGSSSEPSLSLVCHPLIFISLTLCGIPPSPSLGARRALYFLSNLARVPLPPSPPSIRPSKVLLAHNGPRSELAVGRPTAADRIGGLKRKGEGERDHLLARPRDLCEMVIMLTSQDCVGSGERKEEEATAAKKLHDSSRFSLWHNPCYLSHPHMHLSLLGR